MKVSGTTALSLWSGLNPGIASLQAFWVTTFLILKNDWFSHAKVTSFNCLFLLDWKTVSLAAFGGNRFVLWAWEVCELFLFDLIASLSRFYWLWWTHLNKFRRVCCCSVNMLFWGRLSKSWYHWCLLQVPLRLCCRSSSTCLFDCLTIILCDYCCRSHFVFSGEALESISTRSTFDQSKLRVYFLAREFWITLANQARPWVRIRQTLRYSFRSWWALSGLI